MTSRASSAPIRRVRTRVDRQRVNRITVEAYLKTAQTVRRREAREQQRRVREVSPLDRLLITPGTILSTWQASILGSLYLIESGDSTIRVTPGHQVGAIALRIFLPLIAPALALDVLLVLMPAAASTVTALLYIYVGAVALAAIGAIVALLSRLLWGLPLRPKGVRASFRGVGRPRWMVTDLASVETRPAGVVLEAIIGTINAVVPAGEDLGAKARDRALFRIYSRYMEPVGGENNFALKGTAPLTLSALRDDEQPDAIDTIDRRF
jgi:hypothetical protein